jgi:hypothetical protein
MFVINVQAKRKSIGFKPFYNSFTWARFLTSFKSLRGMSTTSILYN